MALFLPAEAAMGFWAARRGPRARAAALVAGRVGHLYVAGVSGEVYFPVRERYTMRVRVMMMMFVL
jgi:hypothetical protein